MPSNKHFFISSIVTKRYFSSTLIKIGQGFLKAKRQFAAYIITKRYFSIIINSFATLAGFYAKIFIKLKLSIKFAVNKYIRNTINLKRVKIVVNNILVKLIISTKSTINLKNISIAAAISQITKMSQVINLKNITLSKILFLKSWIREPISLLISFYANPTMGKYYRLYEFDSDSQTIGSFDSRTLESMFHIIE